MITRKLIFILSAKVCANRVPIFTVKKRLIYKDMPILFQRLSLNEWKKRHVGSIGRKFIKRMSMMTDDYAIVKSPSLRLCKDSVKIESVKVGVEKTKKVKAK